MADSEQSTDDADLESKLSKTVLKLEELDVNLYRGHHLWKPRNGRGVFGGQVVGQALVAATKTKKDGYHVHSLHCYFLLPGDPDIPILYQVERTRDGSTFLSRSVKAIQRGRIIFTMLVSFHVLEDLPVDYQFPMPAVPAPLQLMTVDELVALYLQQDNIPESHRVLMNRYLATDIPIDVKPVDASAFMNLRYGKNLRRKLPSRLNLWIRVKGKIGQSDNNLHRALVAYISDFYLLTTCLLPVPDLQVTMMASLDHSMWFHAPFQADQWMLYECESTRLVHGRGLALGRLWKQDGTLAVSVAQEGVVRGVVSEAKL